MSGRRPICGISACLVGQPVRYDGTSKEQDWTRDGLAPGIAWHVVCPEAGAGYGTPREPINVVTSGGRARLVTVDTKRDLTEAMERWIEATLAELERIGVSGFVLKARSPSCGRANVELFADEAMTTPISRTGDGLFVAALKRRFPGMPIANEEELAAPKERAEFARRILEYAQRRS